jgi:hypothetical protein
MARFASSDSKIDLRDAASARFLGIYGTGRTFLLNYEPWINDIDFHYSLS